MCGVVDNLFNGVPNALNTISTIGSVIPGPWQVPAMMTKGVLSLSSDNPLTGALGALGSFGGATGIGGLNGIGSLGSGTNLGGNLSDLTATASGGGLDNIFGGMSLPSVGGGSSIGAKDIFNNFGDQMSGFSGPTTGGGLGTSFTGLSVNPTISSSGEPGAPGTSIGASPDISIGNSFGNNTSLSGAPASNPGLTNILQTLFQKSGTGAGATTPFENIANGLLKGFGAYQDYQGIKNAQNAYRSQLSSLDALYGPNSPYAQQMQQTINRRDAAAGRNSQYGPRAEELAAELAKSRASVLSSPTYAMLNGAANQSALPWAGVAGAGQSLIKGLSGLFS